MQKINFSIFIGQYDKGSNHLKLIWNYLYRKGKIRETPTEGNSDSVVSHLQLQYRTKRPRPWNEVRSVCLTGNSLICHRDYQTTSPFINKTTSWSFYWITHHCTNPNYFGIQPGGGFLVQRSIRGCATEMGLKSASWYNDDLLFKCKNWYKHGSYFQNFLKLAWK